VVHTWWSCGCIGVQAHKYELAALPVVIFVSIVFLVWFFPIASRLSLAFLICILNFFFPM